MAMRKKEKINCKKYLIVGRVRIILSIPSLFIDMVDYEIHNRFLRWKVLVPK